MYLNHLLVMDLELHFQPLRKALTDAFSLKPIENALLNLKPARLELDIASGMRLKVE